MGLRAVGDDVLAASSKLPTQKLQLRRSRLPNRLTDIGIGGLGFLESITGLI